MDMSEKCETQRCDPVSPDKAGKHRNWIKSTEVPVELEAFSACHDRRLPVTRKPGSAFYETMRQMSAIGNNLNQIAKANAPFVDPAALRKEA